MISLNRAYAKHTSFAKPTAFMRLLGFAKGVRCKMRILERTLFLPKKCRKPGDCGKQAAHLPDFCITKEALVAEPALNVGNSLLFPLSSRNFGQMRLQSPFIPFHPELFQVKSECQEEQLCPDILLSSREKTPEPEVIFQQAKGAFYLDRSAQAQMNTLLCSNVIKRCFP